MNDRQRLIMWIGIVFAVFVLTLPYNAFSYWQVEGLIRQKCALLGIGLLAIGGIHTLRSKV